MGSSSSSTRTSINKTANFNNIDYSGGGGGGAGNGLAKNINLAESKLKVGDIINTDHGAVSGAFEFADSANKQNAETMLALGDRAYDSVESAQELSKSMFTDALDKVNTASRENMQYLNQNTDRALAFATKATRSESGQIAENLTKYMLIGGAGIVALVVITRSK